MSLFPFRWSTHAHTIAPLGCTAIEGLNWPRPVRSSLTFTFADHVAPPSVLRANWMSGSLVRESCQAHTSPPPGSLASAGSPLLRVVASSFSLTFTDQVAPPSVLRAE